MIGHAPYPDVSQKAPQLVVKTALISDGQVFITPVGRRFKDIQFKAVNNNDPETNNTGNVKIYIRSGSTYVLVLTLEPGETRNWPAPAGDGVQFGRNSFKLAVATDGDGVQVIYS